MIATTARGHGHGRGPHGATAAGIPGPDVSVVLARQASEIGAMLDRLAGQPPVTPRIRGEDLRRREELLNALRRCFVAQETAKQRHLWPVLRRAWPDGAAFMKAATTRRVRAEELFVKMRWLPDRDPEANEITARLAAVIREHAGLQASLPGRLERGLSPQARHGLGARLARPGRLTPTRPHPDMPASAVAATLAGPLLGLVDRVVEAFTSSPSSA